MSSVMDAPPPPTCQHSSHPAHKLCLVQIGGGQFNCDGCKQGGQEDQRYRCEPCDFDLHIQCALAPPVFQHPMFGVVTLSPGMGNRLCDACGDAALGIMYHSQAGLDLHPCCAFLKDRIGHPGRVLELRSKVPGSCTLCGERGLRENFWSYSYAWHGGVENIHVACMLYADHNQAAAGATGRSRSTCSQPMAGNPTYSQPMAGNPTYSQPMAGNYTSGHQMTGNYTYSQQMPMPGTSSVFGVVQSVGSFFSLTNNVAKLAHTIITWNKTEEVHTKEDVAVEVATILEL